MPNVRIMTAAQMRWADRKTIESGCSGFELMDRAGQAVAAEVLACMPRSGRVLIVAGPGNNGGDGFAAAYYLRQRGLPVTVVPLISMADIRGDSLSYARRAEAVGVKIREASSLDSLKELKRWLARSVIVVDALFGTGLARPLTGHFAEAVERINACDPPVFSIDVASGIDSDTGRILGSAIKASWTLPIAAAKWGHWLGDGREYSGKVLPAASIGISDATLEEAFAAEADKARRAALIDQTILYSAWPPRKHDTHKRAYGHVWIFGGSVGYAGAPMLAGRGAYAAGAGLVSIVCPDDVWPVIAAGSLEIMVHPESLGIWEIHDERIDAIVAGPGWGRERGELLARLLQSDHPLILDADALNMIAEDASLQGLLAARRAQTVLTPHPGEAARLLRVTAKDVQADRKEALLALIERYHCCVVLKGDATLIGAPEGDVLLSPFGSPRLAVAGTGDVLAGVIAAQLAMAAARRDASPILNRIAAAVALHGLVGERQGWYRAGELSDHIAWMRQRIERHERL